MERVQIDDGTNWPDPSGERYNDLMWRLRYQQDNLRKSDLFDAASLMEAYSNLIMHPAFTLNIVTKKVKWIRKELKNKPMCGRL
jgi:hypothetical protein